MRIVEIQGTNMDLTGPIETYVTEKLDRIGALIETVEPAEVRLDLGRTTNRHNKGNVFRAEANLYLEGDLLRAEATEEDLYAAIDGMVDKLRVQVVKWKDKR